MLLDRLPALGIFLILLGICMLVLGSLFAAGKGSKTNIKSASIIFIGPFPVGWASDK